MKKIILYATCITFTALLLSACSNEKTANATFYEMTVKEYFPMSEGDSMTYRTTDGQVQTVKVDKVEYSHYPCNYNIYDCVENWEIIVTFATENYDEFTAHIVCSTTGGHKFSWYWSYRIQQNDDSVVGLYQDTYEKNKTPASDITLSDHSNSNYGLFVIGVGLRDFTDTEGVKWTLEIL